MVTDGRRVGPPPAVLVQPFPHHDPGQVTGREAQAVGKEQRSWSRPCHGASFCGPGMGGWQASQHFGVPQGGSRVAPRFSEDVEGLSSPSAQTAAPAFGESALCEARKQAENWARGLRG